MKPPAANDLLKVKEVVIVSVVRAMLSYVIYLVLVRINSISGVFTSII